MQMTVNILHTPGGVRFGLLGQKGAAPAPTLFTFAQKIEATLESPSFASVGHELGEHGFLLASLDLPCHGNDVRQDEEPGLTGWRVRLERGDELVPPFLAQVSEVLDLLIHEGYTDSEKVVACGTSRGGFIALHFAAADPRVRCVVAFAPVTDLLALREFDGMDTHQATRALSVIRHADRLAGKAVWICIGLDDQRVSTESCIALARRIAEAAVVRGLEPNVELHVAPPVGHSVPPSAHGLAAAWLLAHVEGEPQAAQVKF
jgi:dienelactone hydrolase